MDCIFCKIKNGEIPSKTVYEDELVMVIMDVNPSVDGHMLVIPKKHYTDYMELDDEIIAHMYNIAKIMGNKIMEKLKANSLTLLMNYGDDQIVKHVHLHLLPNYIKGFKKGPQKSIEENYEILNN